MVQMVRRAQWGAGGRTGGRHVNLSQRRWYVAHWPGGAVAANEAQNVRNIDHFHRNSQGWAVIGYNFLIGRSGTVYEGAGLNVRGIHSPPRNVDGFGVCFLVAPGEQLPEPMRRAGRELYAWLNAQTGRTLNRAGHRTHHPTACPGDPVMAWLNAGMPVTGGNAPAPPPPPPAAPPGNIAAPPLRVDWFGRTRNSRVPDVRIYQQRMRDRGWRGRGPGGLIAADGVFGPDSERVTRQFQAMFRLRVTGAVGPQTWAAAFTRPVR